MVRLSQSFVDIRVTFGSSQNIVQRTDADIMAEGPHRAHNFSRANVFSFKVSPLIDGVHIVSLRCNGLALLTVLPAQLVVVGR